MSLSLGKCGSERVREELKLKMQVGPKTENVQIFSPAGFIGLFYEYSELWKEYFLASNLSSLGCSLSFVHMIVEGQAPAMPIDQVLKPLPANERQANEFFRLYSKEHHRQTSNPELLTFSSASFKYRPVQELFLFSVPLPTGTTSVTIRWRPPHLRTSNDGLPPQAP